MSATLLTRGNGGGSLRQQQTRAYRRAAFKGFVSIAGVIEAEGLADFDVDFARGHHAEDEGGAFVEFLRRDYIVAERRAGQV